MGTKMGSRWQFGERVQKVVGLLHVLTRNILPESD
jgi:hypothetical protein